MVRFAPRMAHLFLVREHTVPEYGDRGVEATPIPTLDPFDDADALEELEEEIATLAAHIHAATHRLLTLIAEFDRRRGWELGGHRSCAHWLSARTGIDLGAAREKVRTARALESLPETGASMARGELSFSKVRALSRVATAENEGDLLEFARGCTTAQLERMVRGFRRGSREDEAALGATAPREPNPVGVPRRGGDVCGEGPAPGGGRRAADAGGGGGQRCAVPGAEGDGLVRR